MFYNCLPVISEELNRRIVIEWSFSQDKRDILIKVEEKMLEISFVWYFYQKLNE